MNCSICGYGLAEKYCRTCGNHYSHQADPNAPGMRPLVNAYRIVDPASKDPTSSDYAESRRSFEQALQYQASFPPVLRMVAWFEYAMRMVQVVGGGPLYKLATDDLHRFTQALQEAQQIYSTLPEETQRLIRARDDYENMIRSNLSEARRVLQSTRPDQESTPKSGGCFIATAAFGSSGAPDIVVLRGFRDEVLIRSLIGRGFISIYYRYSPKVADYIAMHKSLRWLVRTIVIKPIASVIALRMSRNG
jgi:hypothetical protein